MSLEKSESNSVDRSNTTGSDKKIDISDKAAVSIKMAAPVLLSEAAAEILHQSGIKPPYRSGFLSKSDKTLAGKISPKMDNRTTIASILAIAAAFEGAKGWRDGEGDDFMVRSNALLNFANAISTEALGKLGKSAMRDPDEAKQAIISEVAQIPETTLESLWSKSLADAKQRGRPVADESGSSAPVEYKIGNQVVSIGPQGMWLITNGATLFGEGKVGGKAIDVSLESSLTTGLGRKINLDTKQSAVNSETVKVDASVKH